MRKYKTIKTVTLTVEPNSEVVLSDAQYAAAKHYLAPIGEQQKATQPNSKPKTRNSSDNK